MTLYDGKCRIQTVQTPDLLLQLRLLFHLKSENVKGSCFYVVVCWNTFSHCDDVITQSTPQQADAFTVTSFIWTLTPESIYIFIVLVLNVPASPR